MNNNYEIGEALSQPFTATTSHSFLMRLVLWGSLLILVLYGVLGRSMLSELVEFLIFAADVENENNVDFPPSFFSFMAKLFVLMVLFWLVMVLVEAAYHKNLLFGTDHGFFPLRLGNAELMVFLSHLVVLGIIIAAYILIILIAIVTAGIGLILIFPLLIGMLVLMVRLSPMAPLSIREGRLSVKQAWQMSKPHFWIMLGTFVVVAIGSYIVTTVIQYIGMFAVLGNFTALEGLDGERGEEFLAKIGEIFSQPSVFITLIITSVFYMFAQLMSYIWTYGVGNLVVRLDVDETEVFV